MNGRPESPASRYAPWLCLALLSAAAHAEPDPPLPATAEAARLRGDLKVLSIALKVTPDPEIRCTDWKLTKADVRAFFRLARPVPGEEFHHGYYVMPCDYVGQVQIAGVTYDFEINGGSHGWLKTTSSPVIARRFGCPHGCQRLFEPFEFFRPGATPPEG